MLTRWFCVGASARLCSQATVSTSAIASASASASASAGRWFCTSNPKAQEEEEEAKGKTPAGEGEENTRWKVGEPIQGINYNKVRLMGYDIRSVLAAAAAAVPPKTRMAPHTLACLFLLCPVLTLFFSSLSLFPLLFHFVLFEGWNGSKDLGR